MAAATEVGMNDWAYKDLLYAGGLGGWRQWSVFI